MTLADPFYDETDRLVPDYHCEHGTFTGNPYGADYMCGWCESGITLREMEASLRHQRIEEAQFRVRQFDTMIDTLHRLYRQGMFPWWLGMTAIIDTLEHDHYFTSAAQTLDKENAWQP